MKERKTKAQRHLGIIETAASKLAASSFRMKPDNHRHHHVQMVFHDDAGVCVRQATTAMVTCCCLSLQTAFRSPDTAELLRPKPRAPG